MDIEVEMGNIAVTNNAENLITQGVGSCLAITLYDAKSRSGALAHAMMPRFSKNDALDTKYIESAIDEMIRRMRKLGIKNEDLEAKIIGGAKMFSIFEDDIGKQNIAKAKHKLKLEGIQLTGECVGGNIGRSVEISLATGVVTVKTKF